MSRLFYSEQGHSIPFLGEELTTWRRARKFLELPATHAPATLYLLARPHSDPVPLRLAVNGEELEPLQPNGLQTYGWYSRTIAPEVLRAGANWLDFWTDATAMDAWALALEGGHTHPASLCSDDGGATWRDSRMSYLNILSGEYVARLRLAEDTDPPPPPFVRETADHPRLAHLRERLPAEAKQPGPLLARLRALTTWLSTRWQHIGAGPAAQPTPWDAETILAWGPARSGHDGRLPNAMCVHYSVALVTCCEALGLPARCVAATEALNSYDGHFVTEVWFADLGQWVLVDPNLDAVFIRDGRPLSALDVRALGPDLARYVVWGPGTAFQRRHAPIDGFIQHVYLAGRWLECYGIWPRTDFLSRPDRTPPAHGMTAYCETSWVWHHDLRDRGLGMFPHFAGPEYFAAPPQA